MLDRSDLYVRWEEERKQRRLAKEAKGGNEGGNKDEAQKEEPKEAAVDAESLSADSLGPKVNGLFTVVDTSSGLTVEELA